jgi:hypothetical protein
MSTRSLRVMTGSVQSCRTIAVALRGPSSISTAREHVAMAMMATYFLPELVMGIDFDSPFEDHMHLSPGSPVGTGAFLPGRQTSSGHDHFAFSGSKLKETHVPANFDRIGISIVSPHFPASCFVPEHRRATGSDGRRPCAAAISAASHLASPSCPTRCMVFADAYAPHKSSHQTDARQSWCSPRSCRYGAVDGRLTVNEIRRMQRKGKTGCRSGRMPF